MKNRNIVSKASKYLEKKARQGFRGYSIATVALYGPTDQLATKVSVGIISGEDKEPEFLEKWYSEKDVRAEEKIVEEMFLFINKHKPRSVIMVD